MINTSLNSGTPMSRPLCDPIDLERVLATLRQDRASISNSYQEYASTATRPYACDNTLLNVRRNALIVQDGETKLAYPSSAANKPKAIVMTGWSGLVSIEAMRFCHDNNIAIVLLDWSRNFLSIVAPPASQSARLIRAQCAADPASVAREIVRQKLSAYVSVGALPTEQGRTYSHNVDTT